MTIVRNPPESRGLQLASTSRQHFSASELAAMRLEGFPANADALRRKVQAEGWATVEVKGRGGPKGIRVEYIPPAHVLRQIRASVAAKVVTRSGAEVQEAASAPFGAKCVTSCSAGAVREKERQIENARRGVLAAVERIEAAGVSKKSAVSLLLVQARTGQVDPTLEAMLKLARDGRGRPGVDRFPSPRTLWRWLAKARDGETLAPAIPQQETVAPAWWPVFEAGYFVPQKPSIAHVLRTMVLPEGVERPSYDAVRRYLDKLGNVQREAGRMGPRELKSLRPYIRRTFDELMPGDIYTADGHTFDGEVGHPHHGGPFRPEITSVLDVGTRYCTGWSVALSESSFATVDAIRYASMSAGKCAILYVDNGRGWHNEWIEAEGVGVAGRLGMTVTFRAPYSSQAGGAIERLHKTIWVTSAKELATYMGADMDPEARNKVHKLVRKDMAIAGRSRRLMAWEDFLRWCQDKVDAYNNRPHRALGGRTPKEVWDEKMASGWALERLSADEARELFMPAVTRTVKRGSVALFNGIYDSKALEEWHGELVQVHYDIHDVSQVWVRDMEGRLITVAKLDAQARPYMPMSKVEQARQTRAEQRLKRLDIRRQEVLAERDGARPVIEHQPAEVFPVDLKPIVAGVLIHDDFAIPAVEAIELETPLNSSRQTTRPNFGTDVDYYRWLVANLDQWNDQDRAFLTAFVEETYPFIAERMEFEGCAWNPAWLAPQARKVG